MYAEWGGAQIYFLAIMKVALADWDVVVVLPRNSRPDIISYIENAGVRYEFIEACLDSEQPTTFAGKIRRHYRRFHAEMATLKHLRRYDLASSVLHIETLPWQSWQFLALLSLLKANVFVTLHNALPKLPGWREFILKTRMRFVSRLARFHIFASNQDTKNRFRGWVTDKFWESIKVTYTCVDPLQIEAARNANFDSAAVRAEHQIPTNSFVVLCVGQFIDRKGRWTMLEAAGIVRERDETVSFVWVTPNMPNDADFARVADHGLGDAFRLILSSSIGDKRDDILRFFRVADVFALPSYIEGLPIALLEAMAMRIPSISTRINAIPEAISHDETGILIEAGDSKALAGEILRLKSDPHLRDKLSAKGREFVLANFDERVASRIAINEYERCFADD